MSIHYLLIIINRVVIDNTIMLINGGPMNTAALMLFYLTEN